MENEKWLDLSHLSSRDMETLLMLADFFTRFHAEFAIDDETRENTNGEFHRKRRLGRVVISPQDVLSAILYRRDVQRYHLFSSEVERIKNLNDCISISNIQERNRQFEVAKEKFANEIWKRKQNRIGKGRMSKDEDIAKLLSTFEVWATKAIAEEALLQKPVNGSASCSAVLSIPSGDYFAATLPKCKYKANKMLLTSLTLQDRSTIDKNYKGKLGVAPNALTYKEFLRLSIMISSLDDNDAHSALAASPMTKSVINPLRAYDPDHPSSIYSRKENSHQENHKVGVRGVDLVALWLRAQRNTSAFLLLMSLFEFQEDKFEDIKQTTNLVGPDEQKSVDEPNAAMKIWKYNATYKGNFIKMQNISNKFAAMVEDLVKFSVANQFLCTQRYMYNDLMSESKKNESTEKVDVVKTIQISHHLESSAKQFILRWLARRHRRALQAVFAGDISYDHEYISYLKSFELSYDSIKEQTKRILWNKFKTVDRTLSRLDRKIPNPAMECCTTIPSFKRSVSNILSALEQAVSVNKHFAERVKAARIDFELLCNKFLSTTGPSLSNLLRDQTGSDAADVLGSLPEPWDAGVKCATCKQKVSGISVVQCWNCGEQVHEDCIHNRQHAMHIENLEEDRQLFSVYLHAHDIPSLPDYVANPIDWSEHVLTLKRSIGSNGHYSSWGLSIVYTEACEKRYEECVRSILDPTRWSNVYRDFGGSSPVLRVPHSGFLITRCQPDSMLKVGDVVTEISLGGDQLLPAFVGNKVLVNLRHEEIEKIVEAPASEMTIKVFRPSKDISRSSDDFIRDFKNIRDEVCSLHKSILKSRWYCSVCDDIASFSTTAQDEALFCQAIVRRLGMEESSLPFHDESAPLYPYVNECDGNLNRTDDVISVSSCDSNYSQTDRHTELSHLISLRRLDAMMDTLSNPLKTQDKTMLAPFKPPPWISNTNLLYNDRGLWSHPSQILCAGMVFIFEKAKEGEIAKTDRKVLLVQFIKLYFAWCKDVKARRSKGPPKVASMAIAPWLVDSCSYCRVCPVDVHCGEFCKCCFEFQKAKYFTERKSNNLVSSTDFHLDYKSMQKLNDSVDVYNKNTGFVGSLLFVHQHDSLVQRVISRSGLVLEEGLTLCKLLVISYVPSKYLSSEQVQKIVLEKNDQNEEVWKEAGGLFYILPLFGTYQSSYLPLYCKYIESGQSPVDLAMLKLDGIIGMTYIQLKNRLNQTRKLIESVDRIIYSVGKIAGSKEVESTPSLSHNHMMSDTSNDIVDVREIDVDTNSLHCIMSHGDSVQNSLSELRRSCSIMKLYCSSQEFSTVLSKLNAVSISRHIVGTSDDDIFCASRGRAWKNHFEVSSTAPKRRKLYDKPNLKTASDTNASLWYLKNLFVFDAVGVVQEGKCQLFYTDFVFWDRNVYNRAWTKQRMERMKEMNKKMAAQQLQSPSNLVDRTKIVVLQRRTKTSIRPNDVMDQDYYPEDDKEQHTNENEKYPGLGWGFELVLWPDDILRIGRVANSSPAHCAGLKPNDKILSIDGMPSGMIRTKTDLANRLLGCNLKEESLVEENIAPMPYLYQEQCGGMIKDIVVLEIQNDTKTEVANAFHSRERTSVANNLNQSVQPVQHRLLITATEESLTRSKKNKKSAFHQQKTIQCSNSPQQPINHLPDPIENILTMEHLYTPGVNSCFFTMAECAVLIEAMRRNCPKLSVRLLTPRYDPFRVDEEYRTRIKPYIERNGLSCIPRLSETQWQEILGWDLKRIKTESGPVVFKENDFEYRRATTMLPIDRLFDSYFRRLNVQNFPSTTSLNQLQYQPIHEQRVDCGNNNQANLAHSQPVSQADNNILRIRGGGEEQIGNKDISETDIQIQSFCTSTKSTDLNRDRALKLMAAAVKIEEDLAISATSLLGILPNGDMIHWFGSDPTVLYIRKISAQSGIYSTISEALSLCELDCDKECALANQQDIINATVNSGHEYSFSLKNSAAAIMKDKSTFSYSSSEPFERKYDPNTNELFDWVRISDGSSIRKLCADLTRYLCLQCDQLKDFVIDFDPSNDSSDSTIALRKHINFNIHSFVELSDLGIPTFLKLKNIKMSMRTRELIILWVKIACLFCVESNGSYRLEKSLRPSLPQLLDEIGQEYGEQEIISMIDVEDNLDDSLEGPKEIIPISLALPCDCCNKKAINMLNCQICRRPGEVVLSSDSDKHGVGCSLLSDLCYEYDDTAERQMILTATLESPKTTIQVLKNILLKIAANIPLSLRLQPAISDASSISIWGSHFSGWIKTVQMASSVNALSRALVLLKMSLEVSRMPRWWKTPNCGWVDNTTLTSSCSESSLALHLYVLDAAITEATTTVSDDMKMKKKVDITDNSSSDVEALQSVKSDLNKLSHRSIKDRFTTLQKWATELKMHIFEGASLDDCILCGDGGDLICCDYCPNVVHENCLGLKHTFSNNEAWVCNECKEHILVQRSQFKDDFAKIQKWASDADIHVFEGESLDDCIVCHDGGDLLCCEYCPNVAHQDCLGLKHTFSNDEGWVCNQCRNHIVIVRSNML